jgi:hypothetical protein
LARLPTVIGLVDPVAVRPPGEAVTVYELTGAPPLEDGAEKETVAWALPDVAATAVGASAGTWKAAKLGRGRVLLPTAVKKPPTISPAGTASSA